MAASGPRAAAPHPLHGQSTKKITKAQELIAARRIAKAQARVAASKPYARRDHRVLTALASSANARPPAADRAARTRSGPASW